MRNLQARLALTPWFSLGLAMSCFLIAPAAVAAPGTTKTLNKVRPNIVYILADDLGYGDIGCNNPQSKIATPFIDSLATEGMRFTDAHSSSAVCTPSRYSILTGRYSWRSTLQSGVLGGFSKPLIEPGTTTVASLLKSRGYNTACVGKWHLGLGWQPKNPEDAGKALNGRTIDFTQPITDGPNSLSFDYSYVLPASLDMAPYVYLENGQVTETPLVTIPDSPEPAFYRGGLASPSFDHQKTLLTFTQKAVSWIADHAKATETPFFLYLALPSPHTPHVPRPEFQGKSKVSEYGDLVQETDWSVGQVLAELKRHNLDKNTVVMVASDNGSFNKPMQLDTKYGHLSNGEWRDQKSDAWDGGYRIPYLVRWPGVVKPGSVCNQTVGLTDLLATCADAIGEALPTDQGQDSISLLPLLNGSSNKPIHEAVIHHSIDGKFAVREGRWKLILAKGSGGWSLPETQVPAGAPEGQLYDMQTDPSEKNNFYNARPEIVQRMTDLLHKYQNEGRSTPMAVTP